MRVLVVGVSAVAKENYLPYLSALPGVELTLYNRTASAAHAAATTFGAQVADDLAAAGGPAGHAFLLTTEAPRAQLVRTLISVGTPRIFCEKPFVARDGLHVDADDFREGAALVADAEAAGIELAQQFNYRYMATVATALEAVRTYDLGALCTFTAQAHPGCWAHAMDLVRVITGGVAELTALGGPARTGHDMRIEDLAVALRSRAGAVGTVLGTAATSWEAPLFRFDVTYERGAVRFADFAHPVQLTVGDRTETLELSPPLARWDQYRASFRASLDAYFDAIARGDEPPVTGHDGVEELRLEAAMRLSAAEGSRRVVLADDPALVSRTAPH